MLRVLRLIFLDVISPNLSVFFNHNHSRFSFSHYSSSKIPGFKNALNPVLMVSANLADLFA